MKIKQLQQVTSCIANGRGKSEFGASCPALRFISVDTVAARKPPLAIHVTVIANFRTTQQYEWTRQKKEK